MNTHEKVIMSAIIYLPLPPAETKHSNKNHRCTREGEAEVGGDGQKEEIWEYLQ